MLYVYFQQTQLLIGRHSQTLDAPTGHVVPPDACPRRLADAGGYARPVRTIVRCVVQRRKPESTRESTTNRQSSAPIFHRRPA